MRPSARVRANRLNAIKSTGPRTPEGKRRASQNALKHGMAAQVERGEAVEREAATLRAEMPHAPEKALVEFVSAQVKLDHIDLYAASVRAAPLGDADAATRLLREHGLASRYEAAARGRLRRAQRILLSEEVQTSPEMSSRPKAGSR
jgi:hypothetical protein